MAMKRATCQFCGDQNVYLNREHVWPDWLGQAILLNAHLPTWVIQRAGRETRIRLGLTWNITTKLACVARCNGGWMNDLEVAVQPFLRGMAVNGALTLLDDARKATLAAWCMKTTMVYEFMNPQNIKYFTAEERRHVMTYLQPPANVQIWVGMFIGPTRAHGAPYYHRTAGDMVAPSGYSFTFTANQFWFQMLAYREVLSRIPGLAPRFEGVPPNQLIQIWPNQNVGTVERWPPEPIEEYDIETFDRRFWPPVRLIAPGN
jgi:hypothetical protein